MTPDTMTDYRTLAEAFDHLNAHLFVGRLPHVLITLQREKRTLGHYQHEAFADRDQAGQHVSEIALNPDHFAGHSDAEILSTLAHEMCHLWQFYFGKPSRNGYHNQEWARKMDEIGLEPKRADGKPGTTGQSMSHAIRPGQRFDQVAAQLLAGSRLQWQSRVASAEETAKKDKKRASKTKFTCPSCGQNAWAKADATLMCVPCQEIMVAEELDEQDDN